MIHRSRNPISLLALLFAFGCAETDDVRKPTIQVLTRGAQVRGANGIMFGPDGQLYIASVVTPAIAIMNPESGDIVKTIGPDGGPKGPDDLAFGPDGSLYWTDILFGDVGKLTPEGINSVVAELGPGVNPITFSDDGRLFVSQCFLGTNLYEVDPMGAKEPRLITDQLGPGCGLNGMDWGPDGFLYGPRWFVGEVVRVDVETGDFHTVAEGFKTPAAVKFDSTGTLHVLDTLEGKIVRVDTETGTKDVVGQFEPGADNLAFDETDRLFVSSFNDGSIIEVLDKDNNRSVSPGGLSMPGGIALVETHEGERLYVADFFALRELDANTGQERHVVRDVIGFSDLGSVMTVRWGGEHLVLTSWFDNQVRLWDPFNDKLVAKFEGFGQPIDAISFQGDIVVTEAASGSVVRFNSSTPDERTVVLSGLQAPAGLASLDDNLYVADRTAGQILQILESGRECQPPRIVASELAGPEGIAIDESGTLFVVEADAGRLTRIDPETGTKATVADDLELHVTSQRGSPSTMIFNGLAVRDGRIFVTSDKASLVYRIDFN
jgi:sugar lactone lactonase YvrE